ncbi:16S rRNA (guanine(966)-N(2))-methyltransferase RsmD [Maridesulfovibrio bastinii]|uniref:16S rRNA (guanine(966)-N(2))-methyltransferase RsmD n=1 Tax=Maridesulfovibrio bastinii TaxID=47157 RepID=UPI000400C9CA|nr:16S rRNA (guanine(966)-N(2))-methyltransferase RsmD [Maridesulfovibrio bastinii]
MRLVSGKYGGRVIKTASGPGYRPATSKVRHAVFSMLESRGLEWDGLRVADMFAGSGSLAIETLSRGAAFALFVEKSARPAALIKENLVDLGEDRKNWKVLKTDLFKLLSSSPKEPYGLIFVDPPYGHDLLPKALEGILDNGWVAEGGFILAEVEAQVEPPECVAGRLELLTDRLYGQTRILLWKK